jgi:hypothetical protein
LGAAGTIFGSPKSIEKTIGCETCSRVDFVWIGLLKGYDKWKLKF